MLPKSLPPAKRRAVWQAFTKALLLVLVTAIGWLIYQATQRQGSVEEARKARSESLQLAANFATSEILKEINLRFNILDKLAKNEELIRLIRNIDARPQDQTLWKPVEQLLGSEKSDHDKRAPADSWFISNTAGIQVARSPRSDASRGLSFLHRDYFHGQGKEFDPGKPLPPNLKPLTQPHLSAVYRSTSTGQYRVAFSVPIVSVRAGESKVLGVLAMSVDLGEFNVLEKRLPAGHEVVLLDLRESVIDGPPRRGLILHRQTTDAPIEDTLVGKSTANWVSPKLLARIDAILDPSKSAPTGSSFFLSDYRDPAVTNDKLYWGAIERVIDHPADEPARDTGWLVLVQEPVAR
jgi:hypothetical protein